MIITTDYGQELNIKTIGKGFSIVEGTDVMPEIHITRIANRWYAAFVGSARIANLDNGFTVCGGFKTREEAVNWLACGGC